jgi:Na+-driven multidrug efflux pump
MPRPRDAERAVFDDREIVSAAISHRRLLVLVALALFGVVFVNFVLFEVPGLGLGHFFYVPVALLALAEGWGIVGVWCGLAGLIVVRLLTTGARFAGSRWALTGAPA